VTVVGEPPVYKQFEEFKDERSFYYGA